MYSVDPDRVDDDGKSMDGGRPGARQEGRHRCGGCKGHPGQVGESAWRRATHGGPRSMSGSRLVTSTLIWLLFVAMWSASRRCLGGVCGRDTGICG